MSNLVLLALFIVLEVIVGTLFLIQVQSSPEQSNRVSDVVWVALIAVIVPLAGQIFTWLSARRAALAAEAAKEKLDVVHTQIDGMQDKLIRATGAEKLAEGEAVGREKAVAERKERVIEAERVEDRAADKEGKKP